MHNQAFLSLSRFSILAIIRVYQLFFSPRTGILRLLFPFSDTCRFTPHCSAYAYRAVSSFGAFRGMLLTGERLQRCHGKGGWGYDPVPSPLKESIYG